MTTSLAFSNDSHLEQLKPKVLPEDYISGPPSQVLFAILSFHKLLRGQFSRISPSKDQKKHNLVRDAIITEIALGACSVCTISYYR